MAFQMSPSPFSGSMGSPGNVQAQTGPDLDEIQTEVGSLVYILDRSKD